MTQETMMARKRKIKEGEKKDRYRFRFGSNEVILSNENNDERSKLGVFS